MAQTTPRIRVAMRKGLLARFMVSFVFVIFTGAVCGLPAESW